MLNIILSQALPNLPKLFTPSSHASRSDAANKALTAYPTLLSAFARAERAGSLDAERRHMLRRLQG